MLFFSTTNKTSAKIGFRMYISFNLFVGYSTEPVVVQSIEGGISPGVDIFWLR